MEQECTWFQGRFQPYLEDRLGPGERRELAGHLARCPACTVAFSQEWRRRLGAGPAETALAAVEPRSRRIPRCWSWMILLVCLGGMVAFGALSRRGGTAERTPDGSSLMEAQKRLMEALVGVARERRSPVPRAIRAGVVAALAGLRDALARVDRPALEGWLHPAVEVSWSRPGGGEVRRWGREAALADPAGVEAALGLAAQGEISWWSAEGETATLYLYGPGEEPPVFLVFLGEAEGRWRLLWAAAGAPGR